MGSRPRVQPGFLLRGRVLLQLPLQRVHAPPGHARQAGSSRFPRRCGSRASHNRASDPGLRPHAASSPSRTRYCTEASSSSGSSSASARPAQAPPRAGPAPRAARRRGSGPLAHTTARCRRAGRCSRFSASAGARPAWPPRARRSSVNHSPTTLAARPRPRHHGSPCPPRWAAPRGRRAPRCSPPEEKRCAFGTSRRSPSARVFHALRRRPGHGCAALGGLVRDG